MLHHLFHLPFVIMYFVAVALMIMVAAFLLQPLGACARHRCASRRSQAFADRYPENLAFEDYRRATLTRLEKDAEEFRSYLEGLRSAADASAFQSFLQGRKNGGSSAS